MTRPLHIMGVAEVADYLGVSTALVSAWLKRGKMPAPDAVLRATSVWWSATIVKWDKAGRPDIGRKR